MDKTCKSSGISRVAIFWRFSGARVRNTWVICREARNNSLKGELIPDVTSGGHPPDFEAGDRKAWRLKRSLRLISLLVRSFKIVNSVRLIIGQELN